MQMQSGQGHSFQSGIFGGGGQSGSQYPYQHSNERAYADGSLGTLMTSGAGHTYRDGIFSRSAPQYGFAQYNQQAYSDGSLGVVLSDTAKTGIFVGGLAVLGIALYSVYGKK